MKRNIKRPLALLLAIILCLSLLPGTAGAADLTTLIVGGTTVVENGTGGITSGAGWSYENGTLTLKGANIADPYTDGDGNTYGIYADGDLTLMLENASTVESSDTAFNYGVYINGSLTVSGSGSLTAGGTDYGVYVTNAMTANSGSITGNNTGTSDDDYGDGIYVGNTLTVDGGSVTGTGKSKSSKLNGAGIHVYAGGLTVTSGTVTGTAAGERSEGVYVKQGNLAVSGSGSVTGNGSGQWCQGIRLEKGNLEVSGSGSVEGIANDANNQGYGIYMYYDCDLKVTGGTVTGNGCGQSGYGIIVESKITVDGGTVTGTCSDLYGTGIGAAYGLTVSGSGRVTGSGLSGYGIRAYNGDIRITGTDTYVKGTSQIPEYAIYVGTKYALYVDDVRYEPSSVTEFKVENGQVTGAIKRTGSGNVWVNGVKITGDPNYAVICGEGTAKYDPNTGTLTLINAAIDASYEDIDGTYGINAEGDLILVLERNSTVRSSGEAFDCSVCIGGDLTVKGGGTLTVNGSECGIYASNMTVESGTVEGKSSGSNGTGISVRDMLTMKGGSVTGTSTGSSSYGIDVQKGALTVSGGSVTGTGKKAGIYLEKSALRVSGSGSVSGTADGKNGDGIYVSSALTVSDSGDVTGTATVENGWGINVDSGSLMVNGGSVTGNGDSTGIYTGYGLTVNGGDVTGTGTSEGSCGIDTTTLKMTGGIVTGKGAGVAIVTYGYGEKTAQNLISVPANYVPSGYGAQAVVVQNSTYASFAETDKELAYDSDAGTFTNAATEITLKAPGAVSFPQQFYASINFADDTGYKSFGHVTKSGNEWMIYKETGDVAGRTIYGMESAGGAIFTVESDDDEAWMLRVYSSDLATSRTIGRVTNQSGTTDYAIVDTAMDLSGEEPALYGTYNQAFGNQAFSFICSISLTDGTTSNWLQVTGIPSTDIIYAMAFDENGKLYAIGADAGDDGGPASLYIIDLSSGAATATKVGDIKENGRAISTNYVQDLAYDYNTRTLYWMENMGNALYTVDAASAAATKMGQVRFEKDSSLKTYSLSAFCILDGTPATSGDKHMVSVIYDENVTVTDGNGASPKAVSMLGDGESLTLNITPDEDLGLWYVKVDGQKIDITDPMKEMTQIININGKDLVIEVASRLPNPVTRVNTWCWLHYQGKPAKFYTQEITNKFYDWDRFNPDSDTPATGYTQTLLDKDGNDIDDDTILLPGLYGVRVTHPGTEKYAPLTLQYNDALDLAKCDGTPGRPVVYGKVGCKQGDLTTTSALQDYYGTDGELIDAAHDEIPVTLVWQEPDTIYDQAGYFSAKADIYAAELSERILACYNDDEGNPLYEGKQISFRTTQVIVLPADEASLIKLAVEGDEGSGTVSGKGVYKNGTEVTVTATANTNAGYVFQGWQDEDGQTISNDATYTFTASVDRTLTAKFGIDPEYLVRLQVEGEDGCGTVTGGGNYKTDPHSATVKATANPGYYFIGWYDGDTRESTETSYTFNVEEKGITLTAKFGVDYLTLAEQAKETFASAVNNNTLSWAILEQAVEAYKEADNFMKDPPSGFIDATTRYAALTTYYNGIKALDLSNQDLGSADLTKLGFFTGVTDLNLSNNKGVSDLSALKALLMLETLDISGTGVTKLDSLITEGQSSFPGYITLTAKNLTLNSISALTKIIDEEGFSENLIQLWDFTGSTLPPKDENRTDMETIKTALGNKFLAPTIKTTPTGGGGGGATTYAVTVEKAEHGKVTASPSRASSGTPVTITVTPDEGYELEKLTVTDSKGSEVKLTDKGNGKYTFDMPNTKVEIRAVFRKIAPVWENCPGGVDCPAYSYRDVDTSAWYHEAVDYVLVNGLMSGYGNGLFGPDDILSRAQLCQIIYNLEGQPATTSGSAFTDVANGAWYFDAVTWAASQSIVGGYGGGLFGPEDNITREQLAVILYRYAQAKGYDTASGADLSAYGDASDVSSWAIPAMQWACGAGIIGGTTATTLSPQGPATRAQVATILMRFIEGLA